MMTKNIPLLEQLVKTALSNARENGFEILELTDEEAASDLIQFDSQIENFNFEDVQNAVTNVRMIYATGS